ncbi:MAG: hypothetical protein VX435_12430 [Planctomycetota bacterium]|nr:hypothetical protein [Planctomycetota bacterium]
MNTGLVLCVQPIQVSTIAVILAVMDVDTCVHGAALLLFGIKRGEVVRGFADLGCSVSYV